jgi:hypothetical protein
MADTPGLAREQLRAPARLKSLPTLQGFYLAGGTAVAFHLHHRVSRDLDLFASPSAVNLEAVQRDLTAALTDLEVIGATDAALRVRLDRTPIDLVAYPYAPLEVTSPGPADFPVAGLLDLATMKLAAIARRGLRRDFWDLYELFERGGIRVDAALDAYTRRFGKAEPDLYHVLRSLTYFADAEAEPIMPAGLSTDLWQTIKAYFERAAPDALLARTERG